MTYGTPCIKSCLLTFNVCTKVSIISEFYCRRMYNRDLHYQEFGYRSLIELCTSLTSVFHYARPSKADFRLYDRSKPLPQSAEKTFTLASYGTDHCDNNALPSIDVSIKFYKPSQKFYIF